MPLPSFPCKEFYPRKKRAVDKFQEEVHQGIFIPRNGMQFKNSSGEVASS